MAKYLRHIAIGFADDLKKRLKEGDEIFQGALARQNFVAPLFDHVFGKCASDGIAKLIVDLTEIRENHLRLEVLADVVLVDYHLQRDRFLALDVAGRSRFLLDAIVESLSHAASRFHWDVGHIRETQELIVNEGVQFNRPIGKKVKNRNTGLSVKCFLSFQEKIVLYFIITDENNLTEKKLFVTEMVGSMWLFSEVFGKLFWKDDETACLEWRTKRGAWECKLNDTQEEFFYYSKCKRFW